MSVEIKLGTSAQTAEVDTPQQTISLLLPDLRVNESTREIHGLVARIAEIPLAGTAGCLPAMWI